MALFRFLKSSAARVLREPLIQFGLAGALIYFSSAGVKAWLGPEVRLNSGEVAQVVSYWEKQMQRAPTPEELQGILRDRVDEELLAQEAIRLGLDKDDIIIRRRLAQKAAFANQDMVSLQEPSEPELQAYWAKEQTRFKVPMHLAFRHVFFSEDRRGQGARKAAERALQAALKGNSDPGGDPFILPVAYNDIGLDDIMRDYGPEFAQAAGAAPVKTWTGPIQSAYGFHILFVEERKPEYVIPFDRAREDVRAALLDERRQAANVAFLEKLRARYRIVIDQPSQDSLERARNTDADDHE